MTCEPRPPWAGLTEGTGTVLDHLPDRTVFERRLGKYVFALVLTVSRAGLKPAAPTRWPA
jgi:hypothetical protein